MLYSHHYYDQMAAMAASFQLWVWINAYRPNNNEWSKAREKEIIEILTICWCCLSNVNNMYCIDVAVRTSFLWTLAISCKNDEKCECVSVYQIKWSNDRSRDKLMLFCYLFIFAKQTRVPNRSIGVELIGSEHRHTAYTLVSC